MTSASIGSNYSPYALQDAKFVKKITQNSTQSKDLTNFVSDKSKAVGKVLGYGVDSEGYFTSDFNEVAGLGQDYKIHSKLFELAKPLFTSKSLFNGKATHLSIDWAKTLGEYYKNSFQDSLKWEVFGTELGEEQYRALFNDERSWEELLKASDEMITNKGFALTKMFFEDDWLYMIKGETNLNGKLSGVDDNIEYQNFLNFMNANQFNNPTLSSEFNQHNIANGYSASRSKMSLIFQEQHLNEIAGNDVELKELSKMIGSIKDDYIKLLNKDNLSLDEFKKEYMSIKKRHDEFVKQYEEKMKTLQVENTQSFSPLQVKSKSNAYNTNTFHNLTLAQSQQRANLFSILFHQKSNSAFDESKIIKERLVDVSV